MGDKTRLSHSCIRCFKECQRRYYFNYVRRIERDTKDEKRHMGSALHHALDMNAKGSDTQACVKSIVEDMNQLSTDDRLFKAYMLVALFRAYLWYYSENKVTILGSEKTVSASIPKCRSFYVMGIVDKEFQDQSTGLKYVVDHKLVSEDIGVDTDFADRLHMDPQTSMYIHLGNGEYAGMLYDVIKKPGIKPKAVSKADMKELEDTGKYCGLVISESSRPREDGRETPAMYGARCMAAIMENPTAYFRRIMATRTREEMAKFVEDIDRTRKQIAFVTRKGLFVANEASCKIPYKCDYLPICLSGQWHDDIIPQGYRLKGEKSNG